MDKILDLTLPEWKCLSFAAMRNADKIIIDGHVFKDRWSEPKGNYDPNEAWDDLQEQILTNRLWHYQGTQGEDVIICIECLSSTRYRAMFMEDADIQTEGGLMIALAEMVKYVKANPSQFQKRYLM